MLVLRVYGACALVEEISDSDVASRSVQFP